MSEVDHFGCLPWLWITVLVFILDQLSKAFSQVEPSIYQQIMVIPDLFNWTLAYSTGTAFNFLVDSSDWQHWLFALITIVVSAILAVWLRHLKKGGTWLTIALALVLGGALGNLYDRMVLDHVVDFVLMYWQSRWYFPALSLTDSAITVNVVMLASDMSRLKKSGEAAHDQIDPHWLRESRHPTFRPQTGGR